MRTQRALLFGALGASAMSATAVLLRAAGVPIRIEMLLGTAVGLPQGNLAFAVGLLMHFAIGGAAGLVYCWLFERVWLHGGAATGMILAVIHATLIGMAVGLTPHHHPLVPASMADPGPYFSNAGALGVLSFYAMHLLFGAIVGQGYGHVAAEREWAPSGRS
jgi:hypothetical protein